MPTYTVETDRGPLKIQAKLNTSGQVTGRVGGVTYKGATWRDVQKQIVEAHRGFPTMTEYLAVCCLRIGPSRWLGDAGVVETAEETHGLAVTYQVVKVSDPCTEGETKGRFIQEQEDHKPWFRTSVAFRDVARFFREQRSSVLVKNTPEMKGQLDYIIARLREMAGALEDLLSPKNLPNLVTVGARKALAEAREETS